MIKHNIHKQVACKSTDSAIRRLMEHYEGSEYAKSYKGLRECLQEVWGIKESQFNTLMRKKVRPNLEEMLCIRDKK